VTRSATPRPTRQALFAWIAVALTTAALSCTKVSGGDLGFLVATGRAIRALGRIPATNVLSFTEPDHAWLLHEWIPSLLFERAFGAFGPPGVIAIKITVITATWLLVMLTARRLGASPLVAATACLLGAGAAATRFQDRPQIFSGLALAGCGLLLVTAQAASGRRRARLFGAAGVVIAINANVHAGAVTSVALLAAATFGVAVEPARARLCGDAARGPAGLRQALAPAAALAAAIALSMAALAAYHPHGARVLLVPFQLGADADLKQHVVEYRSPLEMPFLGFHLYWLFAASSVGALALGARRLPAWLLAPVAGFAVLSLTYVRAVDAFAIVTAPVLALALEDLRARPRGPRLAVGIVAALAVGLPLDHWFGLPFGGQFPHPPGFGVNASAWPTAMFRYIEDQGIVGPAFVGDAWAGPFLGAFYPRERAFFDPRFEAYSPAFVRDVYRSIRYGQPGWQDKLDAHGVQMVLTPYTSAGEARFQGGRENLRQLLAQSPRWALVGFNDDGELFVRRDGPNAALAARAEIPGVDPDRAAFVGAPALAAPGLLRAVDAGWHDNRALVLAALASAAAGDEARASALLARADAQRPGDPRVRRAREAVRAPGR
jgi:hypothetical protein